MKRIRQDAGFSTPGYREKGELRDRIAKMLWKHAAAIEMLVRDELVPKWMSETE